MFRKLILLGITLASALGISSTQAETIRIAEHRQARIDALKKVVPEIEKKYNVQIEVIEYPELGMEAVWRIEVVDFPAFIVIDDKGNDFFSALG